MTLTIATATLVYLQAKVNSYLSYELLVIASIFSTKKPARASKLADRFFLPIIHSKNSKPRIQSWLKKIQRGGVRVVFWDGETVDYGNTAPKVSIIFHKEPDLNGELEDPMVFFGESYMDGVFDFSR